MDEDSNLVSDLANLNDLNEEQLKNLIELVVKFLVDPSNSDFQTRLGEYSQANSVNVGTLKNIVRSLLVFFQGAMKEGYSSKQLETKCSELGLTETTVNVIIECWDKNSSQLVSCLLKRTIASNQLIDLDWSFGVTAASDELDTIGKTFLQLKLTLDNGEEGTKAIFMELSLDQFYQFLAQMENCKTYIDYVNG